jgi:hypothetical protein
MKVCIALVVLLAAMAASTAQAQFFTEVYAVADSGFEARNMGWDPVGDYLFMGNSNSTPNTRVYNAATGLAASPIPPKYPTTGLTFGSLGFFAQTGSASGKIFAYSNSDTDNLKVWDSITGTPTEMAWTGGFARNLYAVGDTVYATGAENGGPITVNVPDTVNGGYMTKYSIGDAAGDPGGKAGVTATQDGSMVIGSEAISSAAANGIHVWDYNAGADDYDFAGNITFPLGVGPVDVEDTYSRIEAMDVAIDEDDNILLAIERVADKIWAINLNAPGIGDETIIATYDLPADVTYYGSLDIDMANNALYWMGRRTDNNMAAFGKLTYVPEPSALALLALGGLALIRRR